MKERKPGRPPKYDFRLKKGESRDYPFSDSLRVSALRWGRTNNFEFKTTKKGSILTVKRTG